jgi:uncharacterized protein (DUF2249 family)
MSKKRPVTLDVREDIQRGREPFSRIMTTVTGLGPADELVLIAPFEPTPLYAVLAPRGFAHEARELESGVWEIRFTREPVAESAPKPTQKTEDPPSAEVTVDARGLEPPQPLVKILEALATLPEGARLVALTERRPMHLYAQLEERGFVGESKALEDGSFMTYVQRK